MTEGLSKWSASRYLLSTVQRSKTISNVIVRMAYSFFTFSEIKAKITPPESNINTNDLKASFLSRPFLSVINATLIHEGRSESTGNSTSMINPQVIPAAIFNPLIISFFVEVPLKISRRARNPRRGIQSSAITRVMVTALNLLYPGK